MKNPNLQTRVRLDRRGEIHIHVCNDVKFGGEVDLLRTLSPLSLSLNFLECKIFGCKFGRLFLKNVLFEQLFYMWCSDMYKSNNNHTCVQMFPIYFIIFLKFDILCG